MGFRGHQIDWIPGSPGFGLGIPGTPNSSKMGMVPPESEGGLGSLRIARTQDVYRGIASKNRSAKRESSCFGPRRIPHDFLATVKGMNPAIDIRGF